ncbi:unnamed protein product [Ixodes hexagonus]
MTRSRWLARDMFSFLLQEYNLEQKIDLEIKMREGTTKLLAVCQHRPQSLEAAKSLLTSNERMSAYTSELQRRKTSRPPTFSESVDGPSVEPSNARVAVSDIRMPLIWKDTDHFKNKGDYRRFAVFCLLKIGTEIYDTTMVSNIDRSMTDVSFEDTIVFNNIPADFEFRLEVYSHILQDDLSMASTPRKIKTKITNSVSKAIGKKLAASLREELDSLEIGPKFVLEAQASLGLSDADDRVRTHDLVLENPESPQHQLPLFGHFCCKLALVPDCTHQERLSGYLSVAQLPNGGRRRRWGVLKNFQLCFWTSQEDSRRLPPVLSIPINKVSQGKTWKSRGIWIRNLVAIMFTLRGTIVSSNRRTLGRWLVDKHHGNEAQLWGGLASKHMEIPSPGPRRAPVFTRHTSLYDATSLKDSPKGVIGSAMVEGSHHISPTSARPRSSSTPSASSSASAGRARPLAKKGLGYF